MKKGLADSQVKEIKQLLAQQVEENMGMAMMYTLSEAVREYLVENNREEMYVAAAAAVTVDGFCSGAECGESFNLCIEQDGSEHQEMLRRMELKKKKEEKVEADKLEKVRERRLAQKESSAANVATDHVQANADAEEKRREFHGTSPTCVLAD